MKQFIKELNRFINSKRIIQDPLLCYAYGTDASLYRMIPSLVIIVETAKEVEHLLTLANKEQIAITFRAAGTSLSGQAITDSVLVVLANNFWQKYTIHNNGWQISLEPGIIGSSANLLLQPYHTKIGPDPASIASCKIGGIAANNSSGMCCGTAENSYQTMQSIKVILANGTKLDTANQISRHSFSKANINLISGIKQIYSLIHSNQVLVDQIKYKFKIKNTTGYSLNSFIDYDDPIDIIAHLMIGSEGTLGFIQEITYNCVTNNQYKALSLVYCSNLEQIINLALKIKHIQIDAIELLDIASLKAVKSLARKPLYLPPALTDDTAAILIEISANSEANLKAKVSQLEAIINKESISHQVRFTSDINTYHELWELRKGIFPIIGGNREAGSSAVIEDIAVTITDLPDLVSNLRKLFVEHDYTNAAIFGHLLAGNIHFVFTPSFNRPEDINNYGQFMQKLANLVTSRYNGSLKAEHGCGRNMAAFVELEWGKTVYDIMWQIKKLFDPNNILNPDVILSHDPQIHLKNLKELSKTDPIIDKCIECGFCETVCPSKSLTFTPRQRISVYRYLTQLKSTSYWLYKKLRKQYKYYGIDTCATTGICAIQCPVGIDTGKFILKLKQKPDTLLNRFWAQHFDLFVKFNRKLLGAVNLGAKILGKNRTYQLSSKLHKHIPIMPIYPNTMPASQNVIFKNSNQASKQIMYIPSCNNRIFADSTNNGSKNSVHILLTYLGYEIIYPEELNNLCCGQVFDSAQNGKLGWHKNQELSKVVTNSTCPVLIDNSSCFNHLLTTENESKLTTIIDIISNNLDQLQIKSKYAKIALHIDCSSKKLNNQKQILQILNRCADEIIVPREINCCGFAGNKGFTTPELNASALSTLARQITVCDVGVTFNRNCQIGLSLHGQKQYLSLAELVLSCIE